MNPFARTHPFTILLYYICAVALMVSMAHPGLNLLILILELIHYISLTSAGKGIRMVWYSLLAAGSCIIINPLLNHRGVTLLFMLGEWRITWEAMCYGGYMASVLMSSILIFGCFSYYMTAEKIMTLMGKRLPAFSLLFSMILRSVPRAGKDFRTMTFLHGNHPAVWSSLVRIELEDAVERSLSMKSRHYGGRNRSSYYHRKMERQDILASLFSVAALGGLYCYHRAAGGNTHFFPGIHIDKVPGWMWAVFLLFYGLPLIWRGKEELAWHISRRKITGSTIRVKPDQRSISGNWR